MTSDFFWHTLQDWDFPDLNGEDVKIAATDLSELQIDWTWLRKQGPWHDWLFDRLTFYISGKHFNYFCIFMAIGFDWSYWFMTALVFRPCDYAQFWDSETGYIFTMDDRHLSKEHAGAAAAVNCPWFTDNKLQNGWRKNGTDPYVVRVATGTFSGVYTTDENDEMVFGGKAIWLWLLCLPPILSYIQFFWLVGTHNKLVGEAKKKRIAGLLNERASVANQDEGTVMEHLAKTFGAVNQHMFVALERAQTGRCCLGEQGDEAETALRRANEMEMKAETTRRLGAKTKSSQALTL